jgi:hypothetical protein
MPIRFATGPSNGTTLVHGSLQRLAMRKSPLSDMGVDVQSLAIQTPHAVYDLHADEIAAGKSLASAHAAGFRYLVGPQATPVAAAEVVTEGLGTARAVANINYGPFVASSARALQQIENLSAARTGSYEVRLLRFSAIPVVALWLKSDAGGEDIVYPLAPAPAALQAEKAYKPEEFLAAIMPIAKARAQSHGPMVP